MHLSTRRKSTIYFEHSKNCYWTHNNHGGWIRLSPPDMKIQLQHRGLSPKRPPKSNCLSEVDEAIIIIQNEEYIEFAGPLAGHKSDLYEYHGKRILVTDSPHFIESKPGDWPTINKFLVGLLREIQLQYFFGWLKIALESLYSQKFRPGQALALVGPRDSGKSLLQLLITELLGGRVASPYQYMTNKTTFNSDMFSSEHLMIADEVPTTHPRARKNFGNMIKQITANEVQKYHKKYSDAFSVKPFWRLTISLNEEPEDLLVLPPIDDSIVDKIILFKVEKKMMPMRTETNEEREAFWEKLVSELPAFVYFIINWEIPNELKSNRYGITHYHHPEVLSEITELEADEVLLQLIDSTIFKYSIIPKWEGSAESLRNKLIEDDALTYQEAGKLFYYLSACGHFLGKLQKKYPNRVTSTKIKGYTKWVICAPNEGVEG